MAGRHNTMADTAIEDIHGAVYDAAFDRAGIVSVSSIDELFNCAKLMAQQPRPRGKNLVVINNGSAAGATDCDCHGSLPYATHGIAP